MSVRALSLCSSHKDREAVLFDGTQLMNPSRLGVAAAAAGLKPEQLLEKYAAAVVHPDFRVIALVSASAILTVACVLQAVRSGSEPSRVTSASLSSESVVLRHVLRISQHPNA